MDGWIVDGWMVMSELKALVIGFFGLKILKQNIIS